MERQHWYAVTYRGEVGAWKKQILCAHSRWEAIDRTFNHLMQIYPTIKIDRKLLTAKKQR